MFEELLILIGSDEILREIIRLTLSIIVAFLAVSGYAAYAVLAMAARYKEICSRPLYQVLMVFPVIIYVMTLAIDSPVMISPEVQFSTVWLLLFSALGVFIGLPMIFVSMQYEIWAVKKGPLKYRIIISTGSIILFAAVYISLFYVVKSASLYIY